MSAESNTDIRKPEDATMKNKTLKTKLWLNIQKKS